MSENKISEAEQLFNRAQTLRSENKLKQALHEYFKVILHAPGHWPAYYYAGVILNELGNELLAIVVLQRAASIASRNSMVRVTLGATLRKIGRNEEAQDVLSEAIELDPDNIHALFNMGEFMLRTNRSEEAIPYFNKILSGDKDADNIKVLSQWLRGVCRLTLGDYVAAWDDYESRINHPTTWFPTIPGEKWTGQPLQGKRIFLAYEQRFGDVIQFSRFVHRLNKMGAKVLLQAPPPLIRQFKFLEGDIDIVSTSDPLPQYDYYQLITSIPAILNLSIDDIETAPYLDISEEDKKVSLPLRRGTSLKVGLVWSGKPKPDRSIPFACYLPLLKQYSVSFFSFQLGDSRKDIGKHDANWLLHDLAPSINDFYDSSVSMKEMDLIITIDTAAAHQAGALGVPTWLMLIYYSDWRWGVVENDATRWYPGMRIFRQKEHGSWDLAVGELYSAFEEWIEKSLPST